MEVAEKVGVENITPECRNGKRGNIVYGNIVYTALAFN